MMKLTVLGKYGPWPKAGCACSGYLLEAGGRKLLLDCGCGVLGQLQRYTAIEELDGIVLTHLHSDHMGDMMVLRYALPWYLAAGRRAESLPIFLPATPQNIAETLVADPGYDCRIMNGGDSVSFMGLGLSFFSVRHPVQCNAVKVTADDRIFVFSGDMNTTPGFEGFAAGADLLLIDACFPIAQWSQEKPHLSAFLAAGIGRQAGAKRLLLTHVRPIEDEAALLGEARRACPEAEIAQDGAVYCV
jgi:ribonuclease BN (tRNA processing enzyme)